MDKPRSRSREKLLSSSDGTCSNNQKKQQCTLIREIMEQDLDTAHQLSEMLGWPHRSEDWRFLFSIGTGLVAIDEATKSVIATALWFIDDDGLSAAVGMVIVSQNYRGQGIGSKLLGAVLTRLQQSVVYLNSTEVAEPLYRRYGFTQFGNLKQHQGIVCNALPKELPLTLGSRVRSLQLGEVALACDCYNRATGRNRSLLLHAIAQFAETVAIVDSEDQVTGFAMSRSFGRGLIIGPVVADDVAGAIALIGHFLKRQPDHFVRIDTFAQADLCSWLQDAGLSCVASCPSMSFNRTLDVSNQRLGHVFAALVAALG